MFQGKVAMKICILNLISNDREINFSYTYNKSYLIIITISICDIFVKMLDKNRCFYMKDMI